MVNLKHDIEIEVLTPINVGAGGEKNLTRGVDFVESNNKVYVLNLRKIMSEGVDINKLTTYFVNREDRQIVAILGNKLEKVSEKIFEKPTSISNDIKSFIKNEFTGKPIIPGSSLKGAIRSILFSYLRSKERDEKDERDVFGSASKGDEFMRFIKISDVAFENSELVNTKIFNLHGNQKDWQGGWKHSPNGHNATTGTFKSHGFNTIYESIPIQSKSFGCIMLAETPFKNFGEENQKYGDKKLELFNYNTLFEVINNHTSKHLKKELDFFNQYPADKSEEIIDSITTIINSIPEDNSYCILKMSAGSGFHSITGDWKYDDYVNIGNYPNGKHKGKHMYKSRKIAIRNDSMSLMGFVKIRVITEEEKQIQLEAAEKERIEKERVLKEIEKKSQEEIQRKKDYNNLILSAQHHLDNNELEEALRLFEKANDLLPNGGRHINAIEEIKQKFENKRKEEEWKLSEQQKEIESQQKRQLQIESGLTVLEEKYDDGRYKTVDFKGAKNRIEQWMKKAAIDTLPNEEHDALLLTLKRIYSNISKDRDKKEWQHFEKGIWGNIIKWIGEEAAAKEMYDQIIKP